MTTSTGESLVERLRAYRPTNEWGDAVHHDICDEAADEIERLRAALEPFAAVADEWDRWQAKGSTSEPTMIRMWYGRCRIGLPQYQAARLALSTDDRKGEAR